MFEEIAFVRLIPANLIRRQRADVESINARRRYERLNQFRIFSDGSYDKRWTKTCGDFVLIDLDHTRERKQKLFHRERMVRLAQNHSRQHVRTVVPGDESFAVTISSGYL